MQEILFLIYILPGFIIFQIIKELVYFKDNASFEKTIWALFFSLITYFSINIFSLYIIKTNINILNFKLVINLFISILLVVVISVIYLKCIHFKIVKLTQIFDSIKFNRNDVFLDTQNDFTKDYKTLIKQYGIWIQISLKDGNNYAGRLIRYGNFGDDGKGFYLKYVECDNTKIKLDNIIGTIFLDKDIQTISFLKYNFK
ncbi:MAG: hypothetical protein WC996_05045 [Peptostreptococcales bacterium]